MLADEEVKERARRGRETLHRAQEVLRKGERRWEGRIAVKDEPKIEWSALSPEAQSILEAEAKRTGETVEAVLNRILVEVGRRKFGAGG